MRMSFAESFSSGGGGGGGGGGGEARDDGEGEVSTVEGENCFFGESERDGDGFSSNFGEGDSIGGSGGFLEDFEVTRVQPGDLGDEGGLFYSTKSNNLM